MVSDLHNPEQKRRELLQEALASIDVSDLPKPTYAVNEINTRFNSRTS